MPPTSKQKTTVKGLRSARARFGSLLIVEAEDLAAAQAQADNDPFTAAGVFESVEVRPWRVAIGAL